MTSPQVLFSASYQHELESREKWDPKTTLYQPLEVEQIIMPDNAQCLAVRTFLKMLELPFEVQYRMNAEQMSPTGKVPFIKCGQFVVAELEPIIEFAQNKGASLSIKLDEAEKNDMLAYMSLVNYIFGNAETYIAWFDEETLRITQQRYGCVHPFPLNYWVTYLRKRSSKLRLRAVGWMNMTLDQVFEEVNLCCKALSDRLGESKYFFNVPTELDALVFGHIFTILTTVLPTKKFADQVKGYENLIRHCKTMDEDYFKSTVYNF